jgi:hypothetical protein
VTMAVRILHCGKSLKNYNLCIQEKVVGFVNQVIASPGDTIYLAVKSGKKSFCGARGKLLEITDYKPEWDNPDLFIRCFTWTDIEYCQPFELNILAKPGGQYWPLKYIQSCKAIVDEAALKILEELFTKNKVSHNIFASNEDVHASTAFTPEEDDPEEIDDNISEENVQEVLKEVPDARIHIMATFQTINFYNETHKIKGLETLANENFYFLFPQYPEHRTVLIPEHKLFITSGPEKKNNDQISGIRGIPDALLLVYNKDLKNPLQINLIEYECYGEKKTKALDKFNYLNGHIIPQLMRFASTFSVVTDKQIREDTAKKWTETIIDYIYTNSAIQEKFSAWVKEAEPNLSEQLVALRINNMLLNSFRTNLGIILIIDEFSADQKETVKNVINSFKLENGESIKFVGYIVRLEQKITLLKQDAEYALSVQ